MSGKRGRSQATSRIGDEHWSSDPGREDRGREDLAFEGSDFIGALSAFSPVIFHALWKWRREKSSELPRG
ncbi:hypothetical protein NL676_014227 [Syzygium grande]|nr:hypothetical protein NL676_014227 [Syzygium grande]